MTTTTALFTTTRMEDSVAAVSYWHIPDGARYDQAKVRMAYFSVMEDAQAFAAKYHHPPEMAFVIDLSIYGDKL